MAEMGRTGVLPRSASFLSIRGNADDHDGGENADSSKRNSSKKSRLPGGGKAIAAFCASLVAFTIQTEAAQYVQQTLGYRKPFLSLYLGHSSFIFLFPLHLFYLRLVNPQVPLSHYLHLIAQNIHWQISTPTNSLPIPAADSIRRRISAMSLRTDGSSSFGDVAADEFEVEDLHSTIRVRRSPLAPPPLTNWIEERLGFNLWKLLGLFGVLTIGLTIPALSWYSAVPLTTMADITTIYNTYAVWALVFSIWFLGEKWERRKVCSVLLACGGVVLVAYGGAEHRRRPREPAPGVGAPNSEVIRAAVRIVLRRDAGSGGTGGNAVLGDLLAFVGAVSMAAYEMAFKIIGTLPDEDAQRDRYARSGYNRSSRIIDQSDFDRDATAASQVESEAEGQGLLDRGQGEEDADEDRVIKEIARKSIETQYTPAEESTEQSTERTGLWRPKESLDGHYQTISPAPEEEGDDIGQASQDFLQKKMSKGTIRIFDAEQELGRLEREVNDTSRLESQRQEWIPPPLPFGMHPIIVTSGIGLVTLTTVWIGLPIAHLLGWEVFEAPSNFKTVFYIFVVVFTGIIFNGCFSILLAIWGPVLASVSCLLTTVLVFIADILLGHDFHWISLLGCVSIAAGFGVLVSGGSMH